MKFLTPSKEKTPKKGKKTPKAKPAHIEELEAAFEEKEDEAPNTWKPSVIGEYVFGIVTQFGKSQQHGTPFLVLESPDEEVVTVFLKSGLVPIFQRAGWLDSDEDFTQGAIKNHSEDLLAFYYEGEQVNPNTQRKFQKYKVLFHDEIPQSIFDLWEAE